MTAPPQDGQMALVYTCVEQNPDLGLQVLPRAAAAFFWAAHAAIGARVLVARVDPAGGQVLCLHAYYSPSGSSQAASCRPKRRHVPPFDATQGRAVVLGLMRRLEGLPPGRYVLIHRPLEAHISVLTVAKAVGTLLFSSRHPHPQSTVSFQPPLPFSLCI